MKLSDRFEYELESAISELSQNEWAVGQLQDRLCDEALPNIAFENVVDVLRIAVKKSDVFLECCYFAMALARKSETTQIPDGLVRALENLVEVADLQGKDMVLNELYTWYRISPNKNAARDATHP